MTTQANQPGFLTDDSLPWGAALIPEWWVAVTPHHTLTFDEIDEQRRQEAARLAALRAEWAKSPDGSAESGFVEEHLMDTASGPYSSLPGFQGSDGINDAKFIGPGEIEWHITSDGMFYDLAENPDVQYTASQMIESGHLPPGMEDFFVPGWDRPQAATPVDNRSYAKSEIAGGKRPDWLKKKLRSSDEGIALRHGIDGRSSSPDPRRRRDDGSVSSSRESPAIKSPVVAHATPPLKSTPGAKPEWKKRQEEMSAHKGNSPAVVATTPQKVSSVIPEWKRKHDEILKHREEPTVLEAQGRNVSKLSDNDTPADTVLAKKDNHVEVAVAHKTGDKEENLAPWMKNKGEIAAPTEASVPVWKKKQVDPSAVSAVSSIVSSVPSWKKKQEDATTAANHSTGTSSAMPTWKKSEAAASVHGSSSVPSWKKPQDSEIMDNSSDALWKKKQKETPVEQPVSTNSNTQPEAAVPTSLRSDAHPPPETVEQGDKSISQALILKLMDVGEDATRAKELRVNIAPVAENNFNVVVPPAKLLEAIAHHARAFKIVENSKEKIDILRQVAIIARLVIMKLYGSGSPELKQFEDGLRPAFS